MKAKGQSQPETDAAALILYMILGWTSRTPGVDCASLPNAIVTAEETWEGVRKGKWMHLPGSKYVFKRLLLSLNFSEAKFEDGFGFLRWTS